MEHTDEGAATSRATNATDPRGTWSLSFVDGASDTSDGGAGADPSFSPYVDRHTNAGMLSPKRADVAPEATIPDGQVDARGWVTLALRAVGAGLAALCANPRARLWGGIALATVVVFGLRLPAAFSFALLAPLLISVFLSIPAMLRHTVTIPGLSPSGRPRSRLGRLARLSALDRFEGYMMFWGSAMAVGALVLLIVGKIAQLVHSVIH